MDHTDDKVIARRVIITIGLVLATLLALVLLYATRRILVWLLIAVFFAVALYPAVNWTERRVTKSRWLATLLVFLVAFGFLALLTALIIVPLIGETAQLAGRLPHLLEEIRTGRGPIGEPLDRFHLRQYVETHQDQIQEYGSRLQEPTVGFVRGAVTTLVGTVTIAVLAYLMVLQAPRIVDGTLEAVGKRHTPRIRRVGRECARTITGYLSGNLLISVICGGLTFIVMAVMGVPYAGVLALLVALVDLIPLIGATLGALLAGGASFVHSTRAGLVVLIFFVVYQQVENHVLQPLIYSRLIRLSPLTVLISVLIAGHLAGVLGALLAIPAASIVKIIAREVRAGRRNGGPGQHGEQPPATPPEKRR